MLIESFEHAEADFEARLLIEARNEAETVVNATEKSLRRPDFKQLAGGDVDAAELARIETTLAATRSGHGRQRPRADPRGHARAEPRDAASRRTDDEPQRARSACGQERQR